MTTSKNQIPFAQYCHQTLYTTAKMILSVLYSNDRNYLQPMMMLTVSKLLGEWNEETSILITSTTCMTMVI